MQMTKFSARPYGLLAGVLATAFSSAAGAVTETGAANPPSTTDAHASEGKGSQAEARRRVEVSGAPGEGLSMHVGPAFSLNVRSRIQVRYQLDVPAPSGAPGENTTQTVNIGTARLWFSGHFLRPELTYMIQLAVAARDFRDGARSPVYDAYVDWKLHRDVSLRVGQYFVPFDRLRTVREWALQMADRPVPVGELTLDRDVGVTLYSDRFLGDRSPVAWRLGVFGGGGTNLTVGKEPGTLLVGRLEVRPLGPIDDDVEGDLARRKKPGLALGVAGAANFNTDRLRSTTGATFTGGTTTYYHAAGDLTFKGWGFALQCEYLLKLASEDVILSTDETGEPRTEYTRSAQGWVTQASYVFDPPIELVARLSGLYAFAGTDPVLIDISDRAGQEAGAGINYYINGHKLKLQLDWIARMPHDFDFRRAAHVIHAQLDVTF